MHRHGLVGDALQSNNSGNCSYCCMLLLVEQFVSDLLQTHKYQLEINHRLFHPQMLYRHAVFIAT